MCLAYQKRRLIEKNDLILIAGKGHENYQEVNNNLYELNDKNIVNSW